MYEPLQFIRPTEFVADTISDECERCGTATKLINLVWSGGSIVCKTCDQALNDEPTNSPST